MFDMIVIYVILTYLCDVDLSMWCWLSQIDKDGSGTIDVSELQQALELCGLKIPNYQVRDLIAKYDSKVKDGQIDIEEFKQV